MEFPLEYPGRGLSNSGLASISAATTFKNLTATRTLTAEDVFFYEPTSGNLVEQTLYVLHGTPATAIVITIPDDDTITTVGTIFVVRVATTQVGAVTIARQTNGTLNGGTSAITVAAGGEAVITVVSNTADTPVCLVEGDITSEQTLVANVNFNDKLLKAPQFQDIGETNATDATSTGSETYDYRDGSVVNVTLTGNVTTLTISNWPGSGASGSITFIITQDGTGGRSWSHPSSTKWASGVAPTLTTTAGTISIITYMRDGAGTVYGFFGGTGFA